MNILQTVLTSFISVCVLFLLTKLMGKRQISQLSLFDYINGITVGSIAAELAVSPLDECLVPLVATVIYAFSTIAISFACNKSLAARKFLVGKPIVLLEKDTIYEKNLMRAKLDINEFLTCCRSAGYFDISDIESAILETNGSISILPKASARPVTTNDLALTSEKTALVYNLVIDGKVMLECLASAGKDERWLEKQLSALSVRLPDVVLATCDSNGCLSVFEKTGKRVDKRIFI